MVIKCHFCGANISKGGTTCEYCGTSLDTRNDDNFLDKALATTEHGPITNELSTEINSTSFKYKDSGQTAILMIVTCGCYYFWLLADWLKVINQNNKGRNPTDPTTAIFLSVITCSLATVYYSYKVADDAASITRRSGGNTSPIRNNLEPPLAKLPQIVLWGGVFSIAASFFSGGILLVFSYIFSIWSTVALQKSVEYMAGVKS
tara:strand:- start:47 stop:658 length:612 start_codon:yes stop_codon:yes gene_type:complete